MNGKELAKVEAAKNYLKKLAREVPDQKSWVGILGNILGDGFAKTLPHADELREFLEELAEEFQEPEALRELIARELPEVGAPAPLPIPEFIAAPELETLGEQDSGSGHEESDEAAHAEE